MTSFRLELIESDLKEYADVAIGSSATEVQYALGEPTYAIGPLASASGLIGLWSPVYQIDGSDPKNTLPPGKTSASFAEWSYDRGQDRIDVTFDKPMGKVVEISCYVDLEVAGRSCPPLLGLNVRYEESSFIQTLGPPDSASYEGTTKTMIWKDLGLEVVLSKRKAYLIKKRQAVSVAFWRKLRLVPSF